MFQRREWRVPFCRDIRLQYTCIGTIKRIALLVGLGFLAAATCIFIREVVQLYIYNIQSDNRNLARDLFCTSMIFMAIVAVLCCIKKVKEARSRRRVAAEPPGQLDVEPIDSQIPTDSPSDSNLLPQPYGTPSRFPGPLRPFYIRDEQRPILYSSPKISRSERSLQVLNPTALIPGTQSTSTENTRAQSSTEDTSAPSTSQSREPQRGLRKKKTSIARQGRAHRQDRIPPQQSPRLAHGQDRAPLRQSQRLINQRQEANLIPGQVPEDNDPKNK